MSYKVAIIGTGNVAFHLAKRFHTQGLTGLHIMGRTPGKGQEFCKMLTLPLNVLADEDLQKEAFDFAILAVPDKEISLVLDHHSFHPDTVLLHASGAVSIDVFKQRKRYGILYPFQTFTKSREVNFDGIPILVEGSDWQVTEEIISLASYLGPRIIEENSAQRLKIHLAAVFASNFTNNLFRITEDLLMDTGVKLQDLSHLINETVNKAFELSAAKVQTGPAIRKDEEVMQKHLSLLDDEQLKELYRLHSKIIQNH